MENERQLKREHIRKQVLDVVAYSNQTDCASDQG